MGSGGVKKYDFSIQLSVGQKWEQLACELMLRKLSKEVVSVRFDKTKFRDIVFVFEDGTSASVEVKADEAVAMWCGSSRMERATSPWSSRVRANLRG